MRAAYVCTDPGVPIFGTKGCSIHVQQMLRSFLRRGWNVDLYARRFESPVPKALRQVRCFSLDKVPKSFSQTQRESRLIEIDRSLALAVRRNGPYDLLYERHALWSAAAMEYAEDEGIPSILEVNAPLLEEQANYRELVDADRAEEILQRSLAAAQTVIGVSDGVAHYLQRISPHNRDKVRVVSNGVNARSFKQTAVAVRRRWLERQRGIRNRLVVGFTGTLRTWHGMTSLGNSFRQFRAANSAAKLLVIGDGPARDELLRALGRDAAQHTTITGKLPHQQVPRMMALMDIAVAPYPHIENFYFSPLKILEYMACGLPIVASRIGDIPRLLENGRHGHLVTPGSQDAISESLHRIMGDPRTALEMGQGARDAARRQHDWDRKLQQILEAAGPVEGLSREVRTAG
jgi:glycosyltransferase involved in cell wall biosynthesis